MAFFALQYQVCYNSIVIIKRNQGMGFFNSHKKRRPQPILDETAIPAHIAIIMDGNGRWAKKRLQPRVMGHKAGMDTLQTVTKEASHLGVKVLTVYAFSTENWKRPEDEVGFLMRLPVEFYDTYVPELHENGVRITVVGELSRLPKETAAALDKANRLTKDNTGLILNFALNYGGRRELMLAMQSLARDVAAGRLEAELLTEDRLSSHLMTAFLGSDLQDPDLIIRTSGERRLSNFLPWQSAYSELYFTDTLWPDFDQAALRDAIYDYQQRKRRFGGL